MEIIKLFSKLDENLVWYKKVYNDLVTSRKLRGLDKTKIGFYTEKHHILPVCLGGSDEDHNLVLLSFKEHIIAHMLLARIYYTNYKIVYASKSMTMCSKMTKERFKEENPDVQRTALNFLAYCRELHSEHRHRTPISDDQKKKISAANKGVPSPTTWGDKISEAKKGRKPRTSVMDPNGVIFYTLRECSKYYKVTPEAVKYWCVKLSNIRGFSLVESYEESVSIYQNGIVDPKKTIFPNIELCSKYTGLNKSTITKLISDPNSGYTYTQRL